jgi:hypothetical protein
MPPKKSTKKTTSAAAPKKKLSAYNIFVQKEMAKLKTEKPNMAHTDRFKLCAVNWRKSKK